MTCPSAPVPPRHARRGSAARRNSGGDAPGAEKPPANRPTRRRRGAGQLPAEGLQPIFVTTHRTSTPSASFSSLSASVLRPRETRARAASCEIERRCRDLAKAQLLNDPQPDRLSDRIGECPERAVQDRAQLGKLHAPLDVRHERSVGRAYRASTSIEARRFLDEMFAILPLSYVAGDIVTWARGPWHRVACFVL